MATRYAGRVDAYEIWNEPNLAREWGGRTPNAAEYVNLLKVGYNAVKSADPGAIVITAGLSPTGTQPPEAMPDDTYLREMYLAGAKGYYDMIGMHAPGYHAAPQISPDEAAADKANYGGERFFCFRRVEDLRAIMVEFGDAATQVAILEFGWTSDHATGLALCLARRGRVPEGGLPGGRLPMGEGELVALDWADEPDLHR